MFPTHTLTHSHTSLMLRSNGRPRVRGAPDPRTLVSQTSPERSVAVVVVRRTGRGSCKTPYERSGRSPTLQIRTYGRIRNWIPLKKSIGGTHALFGGSSSSSCSSSSSSSHSKIRRESRTRTKDEHEHDGWWGGGPLPFLPKQVLQRYRNWRDDLRVVRRGFARAYFLTPEP